MSREDNKSEEGIEVVAAEWVVKRDRGFDVEEQDAFFQWLGEDPRHGEAFSKQQNSWNSLDLLSELKPDDLAEPDPDLLLSDGREGQIASDERWLNWRHIVGLAAAIALVFGIWVVRDVESDSAGTAHFEQFVASEYEYRKLKDGSEIELNAGTRLSVEYSKEVRLVRLLAGEVHCTVVSDPDRPFIVRAGGADVRAVGTAFNVLLEATSVDVLVTEGKVRVEPSSLVEADEETVASSGVNIVKGQLSVLSHDELNDWDIRTEQVDAAAIESILAWKHVLFDFDSIALSEVVEEFNRRNKLKMVIVDPALNEMPIVASFRSNNVEGFARLLELTAGVKVERSGEFELRISKSD